jgi:nuclear pore complex protein Nup54
MDIIMKKWHPQAAECVFQHYFYQEVGKERAMYFTPGPNEDPKKWEEALEKKPSEGSIPILARGFGDLGIAARLKTQQMAVNQLNIRVHEINDSLKLRIEEHDLKFSVRTQEARRKHIALSRRCLALATKAQVLRNRGYALDSAEEDLKDKLSKLERTAFDPVLSGRQEEIWARMTVVRERAQMLKEETEKLGKKVGAAEQEPLDEENMKKVKKVSSSINTPTSPYMNNTSLQILEDYDSQLAHLRKEIDMIKNDFSDWETATKPTINGSSSRR